jgi:hypothetical protein
MKNTYLDVPATRGALRFRNRFTGQPLGDFLLGYVSDFMLSNVFAVDQRHWASMFFVQDDWKVNSKLSVNLGLRYDFITPALEADNHQANFDPAGGGSLVLARDGSLEDRGLVKPDRNNFAPRVGFVYKIDDRMLVRGGYGVFYNLFDRVGSEDQLALNPPGLINNNVSSSNTAPLFFLQSGFPSGFLNPLNLDPAAGDLRRVRIRAVTPDAPKTTIQQASIGFQREVLSNVVLSVDGVWTKGTDLATLINLNQNLPNAAGARNALGPLPYPNFGFIEYRQQNGRSQYKGIDCGATASASPTRWATPRTTPPSTSPPRVRPRSPRTRATWRSGTEPATTTCATAWPSTSWSSCPSARTRSTRRRAWVGRCWADGRSPGSTRCARAGRSRLDRAATTWA